MSKTNAPTFQRRTELVQNLVHFGTTNPPDNERACSGSSMPPMNASQWLRWTSVCRPFSRQYKYFIKGEN